MRGPKAVGLTLLIALALMIGLLVIAYLIGAALDAEPEVAFPLAYVAMVPFIVFLIRRAYPPGKRTWWRWVLFVALWFLTGIAAALILPWMAVTRRAWREEAPPESLPTNA